MMSQEKCGVEPTRGVRPASSRHIGTPLTPVGRSLRETSPAATADAEASGDTPRSPRSRREREKLVGGLCRSGVTCVPAS
jgi:hypothetical protein